MEPPADKSSPWWALAEMDVALNGRINPKAETDREKGYNDAVLDLKNDLKSKIKEISQ